MTAEACLLSTTYFGPIQWYQKLNRYGRVLIEQHESWQKQTYRNRCLIATTQGVQALTVPVAKDEAGDSHHISLLSSLTAHFRISEHGNWRHLHWQALQSAYGDSPFFEYYEDDLRPFFVDRRWEWLADFNADIMHTMCRLLDICPRVEPTTHYVKPTGDFVLTDPADGLTYADFRYAINPKHPLPDADFAPRRYWQVFEQKHGFLPNLSILDLLFNVGPEAIFYL